MQEFLHRREIEQLPEILARQWGGQLLSAVVGLKLSYAHAEGFRSHEDNLTTIEDFHHFS